MFTVSSYFSCSFLFFSYFSLKDSYHFSHLVPGQCKYTVINVSKTVLEQLNCLLDMCCISVPVAR